MIKKAVILICFICFSFILHAQTKPIISVLDFTTDSLSKSEMKTIISFLSSALFKTGKFTVIDVQERERLLSEIEFSASGCSDESCYLEIGKLLSAQYIVIGNIGKVGSRYLLAAKMLKTESGHTISSAEGIYANLDELVDDIFTIAGTLSRMEEQKDKTKITENDKTDGKKDTSKDILKDTSKDTVIENDDADKKTGTDTSTGTDDNKKKIPASKRFLSVGVETGWTAPLGDMGIIMEYSGTSLLYVRYNLPISGKIELGLGLKSGYQNQITKPVFPYPYSMTTVPLAADFMFHFIPFSPVFFLGAGLSAGLCFNMIDQSTYGYPDIFTTKLYTGIGIKTGFTIMNRFRLYLMDNIFIIFFDNSIYTANLLGIGLEIKI